MLFKDETPERKDKLLFTYEHAGPAAIARIAPQYNITPDSLARYIRSWKHERSQDALDVRLLPPKEDDDLSIWCNWLDTRKAHNPLLTVAHLCDIHAPYTDDDAIELAMQLMQASKPDVIVVGSDFADFKALTTFDKTNDIDDETDVLDTFEYHWKQFNQQLDAAAPQAKRVWIWGNHERRLLNFLINKAPHMQRRVERDFINSIRQGGRVLYIGDVDDVRIGPLQVEHGNRHNEHVSKSRLDDEAYQVNIMFGHVHKFTYYSKRGADYMVQAVSSGCLAPLTPNYKRKGTSAQVGRKWQQGTVIATTDLHHKLVGFESAPFEDTEDAKQCFFRGSRYSVSL